MRSVGQTTIFDSLKIESVYKRSYIYYYLHPSVHYAQASNTPWYLESPICGAKINVLKSGCPQVLIPFFSAYRNRRKSIEVSIP